MAVELLSDLPSTSKIPIEFTKLESLPSKFKFFSELYLRNLTVKEIKQLSSSNGGMKEFSRILGNAILPVPFLELPIGDLRYILALLKARTYRGAYWTVSNLVCPHCGFKNSKIVYDKDLKFKEIDDEVVLPATFTSDRVTLTMHDTFRVKHQLLLEEIYAQKLMVEIEDSTLDVLAILSIPVSEYNELAKTPEKLIERVVTNYEALCKLDGDLAAELDEFLDIIHFDVSTKFNHTCKSKTCGKEFDFDLNVGSIEHFFPEGESRKHVREKIRFGV